MFTFVQAEDGIRDGHVTGVQTCALPISGELRRGEVIRAQRHSRARAQVVGGAGPDPDGAQRLGVEFGLRGAPEIGRASCREIVKLEMVSANLSTKVLAVG